MRAVSLPCDVNLSDVAGLFAEYVYRIFYLVPTAGNVHYLMCKLAWSNKRTHVRVLLRQLANKRQLTGLICFGTVYLAPRACSPRASPLGLVLGPRH